MLALPVSGFFVLRDPLDFKLNAKSIFAINPETISKLLC